MFEEQTPKPPLAPEPQDMFAAPPANLPMASAPGSGSEPPPAPPLKGGGPPQSPSAPAPSMPMMPSMDEHHGSGLKTALMVIGGLIIVGVAGFIAYKLIVAPQADQSDNGDVPFTAPTETEPTTPVVEEPVVEEEPVAVDSDGDGLTDEDESKFGTDARLADTDKDGLGDKEEVQVYGTDPLDPDTDDDTYLDGQEVASGFNPNGDGKLFEVPR